jgi:3-hydroxyisobutyrate dehydrogenase
MNIGIIGTGRMGSAIAGRLLGLGVPVMVWNRSASKTKPLGEAGAMVAGTAADLVRRCDIMVSILTDAAAIDGAYGGRDGALAGTSAGKLFIEMSTVRP